MSKKHSSFELIKFWSWEKNSAKTSLKRSWIQLTLLELKSIIAIASLYQLSSCQNFNLKYFLNCSEFYNKQGSAVGLFGRSEEGMEQVGMWVHAHMNTFLCSGTYLPWSSSGEGKGYRMIGPVWNRFRREWMYAMHECM